MKIQQRLLWGGVLLVLVSPMQSFAKMTLECETYEDCKSLSECVEWIDSGTGCFKSYPSRYNCIKEDEDDATGYCKEDLQPGAFFCNNATACISNTILVTSVCTHTSGEWAICEDEYENCGEPSGEPNEPTCVPM